MVAEEVVAKLQIVLSVLDETRNELNEATARLAGYKRAVAETNKAIAETQRKLNEAKERGIIGSNILKKQQEDSKKQMLELISGERENIANLRAREKILKTTSNTLQRQIRDARKFKFEWLSIMFYAMQVNRIFRQYTSVAMEMVGVNDLLTNAISMMVYSAWEPYLDTIYDVVGSLYDLPEPLKKLVGGLLTFGDVASNGVYWLAQTNLALQGLELLIPGSQAKIQALVSFALVPFKEAWAAIRALSGIQLTIAVAGIALLPWEIEQIIKKWKELKELTGELSKQMEGRTEEEKTAAYGYAVGGGLFAETRAKQLKWFFENVWSPLTGQKLQHGGIITKPTLALVGEAGPEAVIPLGAGAGMNITISPTINISAAGGIDAYALGNQLSSMWATDIRRIMQR